MIVHYFIYFFKKVPYYVHEFLFFCCTIWTQSIALSRSLQRHCTETGPLNGMSDITFSPYKSSSPSSARMNPIVFLFFLCFFLCFFFVFFLISNNSTYSKLVIDDKVYKFEDIDELPHGLTLEKAKIIATSDGWAFQSHHAFLSNMHPSKFEVDNKEYKTNEHYYQSKCAAFHNDPILERLKVWPTNLNKIQF